MGNNLRRQAGSFRDVVQFVVMALYSLLLMAVLVVGAPYWLARMATSGRYRAGLGQRLGRVPAALRAAVAGRRVVWVHAVSVGEVLAATRLVAELETALGDGWSIVISTTTETGQALARERFGTERVFYYPLDFAWAVRAYLRAFRPRMLVLMESELWPRMLVECGRARVPVAVVNARVSDRSYSRGLKVKAVWGKALRRVDLFLAQSEEDARRLVGMGARAEGVRAIGNLKYDVRAAVETPIARLVRSVLPEGSAVVVAGSTLEEEEEYLLRFWKMVLQFKPNAILVLAPRHPERFGTVATLVERSGYVVVRATRLDEGGLPSLQSGQTQPVILLDTIGDLASVYGLAAVAFVGGSMVPKGGHNPLEPAQFGIPVVMGESYENFRDVVRGMLETNSIWVGSRDDVIGGLIRFVEDRETAVLCGANARRFFESKTGATARAVEALVGLVHVVKR
jgi:3-deoxy-D-manno-octulosonic-acid transferase